MTSPASLASAQQARAAARDERERPFVDVVTRRVADVRGSGAQALMSHLAQYPRDVLAASAAVPTIAFSGVTDVQQEAWDLVEGLAPAYGDHWWYISLLAFTRQDQSRFDEAGMLAESALSCEPSSGHAVHAQTHVLYETGQHEGGRVWLDHWVAESGRGASHRAHFAWHAALHDLALGDTEAVRQRYYSQLATRLRHGRAGPGRLGVAAVAVAGHDHRLGRGTPARPALDHPRVRRRDAATTCGAAGPRHRRRPPAASPRPRSWRRTPRSPSPVTTTCPASPSSSATPGAPPTPPCAPWWHPLCAALLAALEARWELAWRTLTDLLPVLVRVGGSAAQREVVEETLLLALVNDGRAEQALTLLDRRLDRRTSSLDQRRKQSLVAPVPLTSA